jgi:hypothetical protein
LKDLCGVIQGASEERELDGRVLLSKTKDVAGEDMDGGEHQARLDERRGLRQVVCLGENHPCTLEHREKYVPVVSSIHWPEDKDQSMASRVSTDKEAMKGKTEREGESLEIRKREERTRWQPDRFLDYLIRF